MKTTIHANGQAAVIELAGTLDSSFPEEDRQRILEVVQPGCALTLDFSRLEAITSIGMRMLLLLARQIQTIGGSVVGKGAPPELQDAAEAAGFLPLYHQPPPAGIASSPLRLMPRVDAYPTHFHAGFALRPGFPLPLGATFTGRGVNFAVYSRYATACSLVLFGAGESRPYVEIPFLPEFRIGDVFAMTVFDLDVDSLEYGFRMDGPNDPRAGHRFDASRVLIDPAAKAIRGRDGWGCLDSGHRPAYRSILAPQDFDWQGDRPPGWPMEDLVVYEMHVRGFTRSPSSGVKPAGTFAGLREKIPYLQELGVNCVELMPIFEFDEMENDRLPPQTGERLWNYWGYSTVGFYAPKAGYAATGRLGMQVDEFKTLVRDLHRHGIEVILDVVFNHTAEGNERGSTISFRGLDNRTYYMLTPDGDYYNFSGCGNTLNCNHPVVRDFVVDCLRFWVAEYHIDGFRFDLASILGRDASGAPLANPPLLESLALDPVLAKTKLIAEAWDAGGLYQVGSFPAYGRWAEWNGKYRDCVRRFLKGDEAQVAEMAQRLAGSPDLYYYRGPTASVNFVTCHDGFTLADLVSYNNKHNEANGEDNRDGGNDNHSWNCGVEGATDDPGVLALRFRQIKNALAMLLVSQGPPMLLMGDEFGRTQHGNNNAYCHDSNLNWLDWTLKQSNAELFQFCRRLIAFRQSHPALRNPQFAGQPPKDGDFFEITFHGVRAWQPDWAPHSRTLAMMAHRAVDGANDVVYAAFNMFWEPLEFELPTPAAGQWRLFANTGSSPPFDICEPGQEQRLENQLSILVGGRSMVILVGKGDILHY
jgi:glycogen operon protein